MATTAAKLLEQALALTPEERMELVCAIEASVDPQDESPEWAAAWRSELASRRAESTVPRDQMFDRLLSR